MLDKYAERVEGAAMLVRLLGAEEYASTGLFSHPLPMFPTGQIRILGIYIRTVSQMELEITNMAPIII